MHANIIFCKVVRKINKQTIPLPKSYISPLSTIMYRLCLASVSASISPLSTIMYRVSLAFVSASVSPVSTSFSPLSPIISRLCLASFFQYFFTFSIYICQFHLCVFIRLLSSTQWIASWFLSTKTYLSNCIETTIKILLYKLEILFYSIMKIIKIAFTFFSEN